MKKFLKSKWFFYVLFGIGLLSITFFYKTDNNFTINNIIDKSKHPTVRKQKESSKKILSISEIEPATLPPEAKPLLDNLVKLQNQESPNLNPELENHVKEAEALIAKTDKVLADQGFSVGMPELNKELSEKSEVENRIAELQEQLSNLTKAN